MLGGGTYHAEHEENLEGRNPRDGARRVVSKQVVLVVLLKDPNTVQPTETAKRRAPAAENHQPRDDASIRGRVGIRLRGRVFRVIAQSL
jgi:hypothetical protein